MTEEGFTLRKADCFLETGRKGDKLRGQLGVRLDLINEKHFVRFVPVKIAENFSLLRHSYY